MNIFVMRHGLTVWNEKKITQGRTNNRLSKSGIEKTEQVSLEHKNTAFDLIICSPLMRTVQTANIMNKYHDVQILKDERITEIDQGIFSKRHKDSLTEQEKLLKNVRSKSCNMESYSEVFNRVNDFVSNLKAKYGNYSNILIVSHACVATMLENILTNRQFDINNPETLRNFDNAQIKKFEI